MVQYFLNSDYHYHYNCNYHYHCHYHNHNHNHKHKHYHCHYRYHYQKELLKETQQTAYPNCAITPWYIFMEF